MPVLGDEVDLVARQALLRRELDQAPVLEARRGRRPACRSRARPRRPRGAPRPCGRAAARAAGRRRSGPSRSGSARPPSATQRRPGWSTQQHADARSSGLTPPVKLSKRPARQRLRPPSVPIQMLPSRSSQKARTKSLTRPCADRVADDASPLEADGALAVGADPEGPRAVAEDVANAELRVEAGQRHGHERLVRDAKAAGRSARSRAACRPRSW